MILQFGHSRDYNYQKELYDPIINDQLLTTHTLILPHLDGKIWVDSRNTLKTVDVFFAEVSYPSLWLWIELWFAALYEKNIVCLYKKWSQLSWSLKYVSNNFIEYEDANDLIIKIKTYLLSIS